MAKPRPQRKPRRAVKKPVRRSKPDAPTKPADDPPVTAEDTTLPIDLQPGRIEETLHSLQQELKHWANQGRFTRVRFKFRGKPILPDLPLAAVVAAEGLTFYWGGLLRMLVVNLAGRSLLQVELVHD